MWAVRWGESVPLQTHLTIVQHRSHFSGCYVNHNTPLSMSLLSWQSEFGFFELSSQEVVRIKSHHLTINSNYFRVAFNFIIVQGCSRFSRAFPEVQTGRDDWKKMREWMCGDSFLWAGQWSQSGFVTGCCKPAFKTSKTHQVSYSPTKNKFTAKCLTQHALLCSGEILASIPGGHMRGALC